MNPTRRLLIAILCLAIHQAAVASQPVASRTLIHPFPPTGPVEVAGTVAGNKVLRAMQRYAVPAFTDLLATHVAQTLQAASDQPVDVTRKSRRNGLDAVAAVSSAAADGRTLLLTNNIPAHSTTAQPPGRNGSALRPVALVATMPLVIVASADSNYASLRDLIRDAQRTSLLVATAAERSTPHLASRLLRSGYGLRIESVPHNGGNAALQAVQTNQVKIAFVPLPALLAHGGGGRVRMLAIAERQPHPAIPHVQTASESGLPDFTASSWFGIFVPAATPQAVVQDLNAMLAHGFQSEQTRQLFSSLGLRLDHRAAEAFTKRLVQEQEKRSFALQR